MSYDILILRRAQKELAGLSGVPFERVKAAIQSLSADPRPHSAKKLTGREGWRICVGNHRIIYEIDDDKRELTVLHIGLRKDVYR